MATKNRRWRLLPLTFVFAAGLALGLVPITLGLSLVASTISNYHEPLYYLGGALMLALAAYSLTGRMWSLSFLRAPDASRGDAGLRIGGWTLATNTVNVAVAFAAIRADARLGELACGGAAKATPTPNRSPYLHYTPRGIPLPRAQRL